MLCMSKLRYILKLVAATVMMVVAVGVCLDERHGNSAEDNGSYQSCKDNNEREQYVEICADIPYAGIAAETISIPVPTTARPERSRVQWNYTQSRPLAYALICGVLSSISANYTIQTTSEAIALCNSRRPCDYYVYAERKILI